jgi:predicted transcriptional regulator
MDQDLTYIGKLRRQLGLTQKKLAKLSGVSQSLIAKIESGKIDPAYSKVKQIIGALEDEQSKKESKKKAYDIMSKNIVSLSSHEQVGAAIDLMKRKDISQIPVMDKLSCVGSISENVIVESISEYGNNLASIAIEKVMDEAFPTIPAESDIEAVAGLLKFYKAVLVKQKGKTTGIITKADLLKAIE